MVRLEKIAYEKIFNSKVLSRARTISSPKKRDAFNDLYLRQSPQIGIVSKAIRPVTAFFASFWWGFFRDNLNQRGIKLEDIIMTSDPEARRGVVTEHINREAMHPYHLQLNAWKRMGHGKVDFSMMGFEAPDYVQEECKNQTFVEVMEVVDDYKHFVLSNYVAEMSQQTFIGRGSNIILEVLAINGLLMRTAWNTYFFNEDEYINSRIYLKDFVKTYGLSKRDEDREVNRKQSEAYFNKMNKMFPGFFAPEGAEIDFKKMWAGAEREREKVIGQMGEWSIENAEVKVRGQDSAFMVPESGEPDAKGVNNIGKVLPSYLKRKLSGFMQ